MQLPFHVTFGLILLGTGALLVALAMPLWLCKIPMNHWYGVRFPQSFISDEHWYRINAYGGRLILLWSLPTFPAGIIALFLPFGEDSVVPLILISVPVVGMIIASVITYRYATHL